MSRRALTTVVVAGVLAVATACGEPGHVIKKTTEGLPVTGEHYVWCQYPSGRVAKQRAPYNKFRRIRIGDPC